MDSKKPEFDEFFPNANQFQKTCLSQEFPFPMPFMKYIWMNPLSHVVYRKLTKCCKLFFIKHPLLVIENLRYSEKKWSQNFNQMKLCEDGRYRKKFNKTNITKLTEKIWLGETLSVAPWTEKYIATILNPKNYRCDIKYLLLHDQILSYDNFKFLSAAVEECHLGWSFIKYDNDELVPLEEIVKLLSGCKKFWINFYDKNFNADCKNYANFVTACNSIEEVRLTRIPNNFNISAFFEHLKKSKSSVLIHFCSVFPEPQLDEIINEINRTAFFDYVPPVIEYIYPHGF